MDKLEPISNIICAWLRSSQTDAKFDRAYIFGSLVNDDAQFFVPSGMIGSDIDILLRFNPNDTSALARINALKHIRSKINDLEVELCAKLELTRADEPILSVLPVTWYEICHSVHKGHDPKIFSLNIFYDIFQTKLRDTPLTGYVDYSFHLENIEAFAVMKICQQVRNQYLKIPVNRVPKLKEWNDSGILPKEIMRAAAMLNFADKVTTNPKKNGEINPEMRARLLDGLTFLVSLLQKNESVDRVFAEALDVVEKRRFPGVAKQPALKADHLITISEVLFDHAKTLPKRTVREAIDQYIRKRKKLPLYPI